MQAPAIWQHCSHCVLFIGRTSVKGRTFLERPKRRDLDQINGQGTRLSQANPWDTYAAEMDTKLSKEMAAAVAEYSERVYDATATSNQTKEEFHRQKEASDELSKEYQWLKPDEYADVAQRTGRVLHASVFLSKLRENGVKCWYAEHPQPQKVKLVVSRGNGTLPPEVACWVQFGYMPELSIMRFDEHGVPLDERRRGWRTCLLQIILKGILTEETAHRIFGRPKQTDAYARYNRLLRDFRNAGSSLGD